MKLNPGIIAAIQSYWIQHEYEYKISRTQVEQAIELWVRQNISQSVLDRLKTMPKFYFDHQSHLDLYDNEDLFITKVMFEDYEIEPFPIPYSCIQQPVKLTKNLSQQIKSTRPRLIRWPLRLSGFETLEEAIEAYPELRHLAARAL